MEIVLRFSVCMYSKYLVIIDTFCFGLYSSISDYRFTQHYLCFAETNSPLKVFIMQSSKMSPEEKAAFLEKDEVV